MRRISRIFVHCTAGWQATTTEHTLLAEFRAKGWKRPGYHYVVKPDGNILQLLDESEVANGVYGYNQNSVHVAWIGGIEYARDSGGRPTREVVSVDNRTDAQRQALFDLLVKLKLRYRAAVVLGHRDISPDLNHNGVVDPWERVKDCPCFDAMVEYMDINKIG